MALFLLVTNPSPPSGGGSEKLGEVDEDWRLEKAEARPVLDRRRPEVAPRDHPQNPRARSSYDTEVVAKAY